MMKGFMLVLVLMVAFSCDDSLPIATQPDTNVAQSLFIFSQEALENIDFEQIDTIHGVFEIMDTEIEDLSFLTDICVTGRMSISNNRFLRSLDGLENLSCLPTLMLRGNENLKDIEALGRINVTEELTISGNGLDQSEPIPGLTELAGKVLIAERGLPDYGLLSNLKTVDNLTLGDSRASNLNALENLTEIKTRLRLSSNVFLSDFCGIKTALENSEEIVFETSSNQVNPTREEIISDCP